MIYTVEESTMPEEDIMRFRINNLTGIVVLKKVVDEMAFMA